MTESQKAIKALNKQNARLFAKILANTAKKAALLRAR